MIEMLGLSKQFETAAGSNASPVQALDGFYLLARDGHITALLGPNGAGKTTALKILAGVVTADAGQAQVDGLDVRSGGHPVRGRLGLLLESTGLYPRLTARENIVYYGRLQGLCAAQAQQRASKLARLLDMTALLDRRVAGFSQGERMKTALARCLVHDPPNIVLDEPTNGLDVASTRLLRQTLARLRDETGKCILFSTHVMQEVSRLCDHVVVMYAGLQVAAGTVDELLRQTGQSDLEDAFVSVLHAHDPAHSSSRG